MLGNLNTSVQGTLVKTYGDSFFLRFHANSMTAMTVLSANPFYKEDNDSEGKPIVVIQIMACEGGYMVCELMYREDFNNVKTALRELEGRELI